MRTPASRRHGPRLARAVAMTGMVAALSLGVAATASAAEEGEEEAEHGDEDDGNPGPLAAAVVGLALGGLGFAMSEAGEGPYPEEHH